LMRQAIFCAHSLTGAATLARVPTTPGPSRAWFKKCHFQVTPEIDKALMIKGFLVLGVTLI